MRLWTIILLLAALASFSPQANADEWSTKLFIPARNGESAQIVDTETGQAAKVLEGIMGERPQECPQDGYWADAALMAGMVDGRVVTCADGQAYALMKTPEAALRGGYALVPAKPKPGTDDPGPSKKDPASMPEVTP
jgi:hypothetical protein